MSFEALAAQLQTEYEQVAPDSLDWMPDDGDYDVQMTSFRTGTFQDKATNEETPFIASTFEMIGGDNDGSSFDGGMIAIRTPKALGFAKRFVERALGKSVTGLFKDDCETLEATCKASALPCKVRVVTNTSADGRDFHNVYLQSATLPVPA
jgi:hypothetical protein